IHIVQPGETLSSIARRYGVSYYTIAVHNGIRNANLLKVGQRLRIPQSSAQPTSRPAVKVTKPAATGGAQSRPEEKSTQAPSTAQKGRGTTRTDPEGSTGSKGTPPPVTRTPTPTSTPTSTPTPRIHVVKPFETLSSIAARYGTTVWAIKRRNRLRSDVIQVGQMLLIP
ncbi:MAG: LysM peptidoglycan-binding domain-containing protein, partial [Caldilineae bacterium]